MLKKLELTTLEERRRHLRLTMLYKVACGKIPALPPESFLTPLDNTRRRVRPRRFADHHTPNPIQRQACNNSRGFKIPTARSDQYKESFFVKTPLEWNILSDDIVTKETVGAFSAAVCKLGPATFNP